MQQRKQQFFIAAGFAVAAGIAVLSGYVKPTAAAVPPVGPPEVGVLVVQPQKVALTIELAGRAFPYVAAEVRPQIAGIVKQLLFQEGADVGAGEALYRVDPATYHARHDSARASLAKTETDFATARINLDYTRLRSLISGASANRA